FTELDTVVKEEGQLFEVKYFSKNKTFVFWNMDDYPIPEGVAPLEVIDNIKSVLHRLGFPWWLIEIRAYGDDQSYDLCSAGIYGEYLITVLYVCNCLHLTLFRGKISGAIKFPIELIDIATLKFREPLNFVVIAKHTPQSQLRRVLDSLKSRNNVVASVELPDSAALSSIESLVNSIKVFGGIQRPLCRDVGERADVDVFRWTIAYRPFSTNKEDGYSCDWSFYL
ncbi:unnamed protein product, partial [Brassica oleracea]